MFPIIHDITQVNMNAIPVKSRWAGEASLITRNKMRVDATAEFFVGVLPTKEGVSLVARTLGDRTDSSDKIRDVVQSRFVNAMAAVAASMTMEEIRIGGTEMMRTIVAMVRGGGPRLPLVKVLHNRIIELARDIGTLSDQVA